MRRSTRSAFTFPLEDGTAKLLPVLLITAAHSRFVTGGTIPTAQGTTRSASTPTTTQSTRPVIGRLVDVTADLDRVRVRAEGRVVAEHRRVWARGTTLTDPSHDQAAARLRKQFQQPRAVVGEPDDLARDLGDYDRAFGLTDNGGFC